MKALLNRLRDWQHWPFYLFYLPISYAWLGYYIKTRSLWFFTASNPTLSFGGFEGERKSEIYQQLPPRFCPHSIYIDPEMSFSTVVSLLRENKFSYPFIVKPDVGMKGILFRKIDHESQLWQYHRQMPVTYIIQEFLHAALEVSVFYCRMPGSEKGRITALIQKNLFEIVGDGMATIEELLEKQPHIQKREDLKRQHWQKLHEVLKKGERFCVSYVANLVNGAQFDNLTHLVDDNLLKIFDYISHQSRFYYGRYDIKCHSIEDLKKGNFKILEFNGAGSVPNHIYTGTFTLRQAYKEVLFHWRMMHEISRINHNNGIRYWGFKKGRNFLRNSKQHFKRLKKLDKELVLT